MNYLWEVRLPSTIIPIAKTSFFLAIFVALVSGVQAFTDDSFKERFTEWLHEKANSWVAVSSIYQSVISPDYQFWEYVVNDQKKGLANVSIIVPKNLSEEEIKKACEHMEAQLQKFRNLIIITAFEQNMDRPNYKRGIPGNRWQLLHNKHNSFREFSSISFIPDETRYQYFLGMKCLQEGGQISNEWFGDDPERIALARVIWDKDEDHSLILHPYVYKSGENLFIEIYLTKRLRKSGEYYQFVQYLLSIIPKTFVENPLNIWITLYFRDTVDMLASLHWGKSIPYIEYKDETITKIRFEKPKDWGI